MTTKVQQEPVAAWATDCRDKYAENHDSGYAGRICLSDGNLAWAAVIADGAGGSMEGLKVSALAIQAFVEAMRRSTLSELSDSAAREAWMRQWTKALHDEAFARFKGGMATFCGAVLLPAPTGGASSPSEPSYRLFALNVGDSQVMMLSGNGRCLGITPDAPPNNANVEGHNPIRVVGVAPKGDFALLDIEEFPIPAEGPVWILAGSDGFFSKKKGKDELAIFSSGDLRDVCLGSRAPFHELPSLAIRRSLENARKLGAAEMMDNATVAMLGLRVPATDLVGDPGAFGATKGGVAADAGRSAPTQDRGSSTQRNALGSSTARSALRPSTPRSGLRPSTARSALGLRFASLAAALAVGMALGAMLGGFRRSDRHKVPSHAEAASKILATPPADAATDSDDADMETLRRCPRCWKRYMEKHDISRAQTFHWADDPKCPTPPDSRP